MKKLVAVYVLGLMVAAAVFADHPDGWGIGLMGGGGGGTLGGGGGALSLKVPSVPIYWGIDFGGYSGTFWLGLNGDYYFLDNSLTDVLSGNLGWYFGLGGHLGLSGIYSNIALRVPVGLSWQLKSISAFNALEVFIELVPNIGFSLLPDLYWNIGGELGVRIWLK